MLMWQESLARAIKFTCFFFLRVSCKLTSGTNFVATL